MNKKSDYIIILLLSILVALIPFVCNIYYATPDDPRYIGLVSGAYTGTPVKELVYVGTILGSIESWLYKYIPQIEWYSVIYYLLALSSFIAFLICTLNSHITRYGKYALLCAITAMQVYLSLTPQFTTLSTQLSFASLATFLTARGRKRSYIFSIIFFFLATQIRLAAAFLPYMVACPLLLLDANHRDRSWWEKSSWIVGLIMAASLTFLSDRFVYSSEEWISFNTTNDARAYIADNPTASDYSKEIKSQEDKLAFELLYRYRIFDLNILTPDKFQHYQQDLASKALSTIQSNIIPYFQVYLKLGLWMVIILGLLLIIESFRKKRWWRLFLFCLVCVLFLLANLQMMSYSFYKERVMLGSFASFLFASVYLLYDYGKYANKVLFAVCVLLVLLYVPRGYKAFYKAKNDHTIITETEKMISQAGVDKVMLTVPVCLTPEAFHTSTSPIYKNSVIQGWMHYYPKIDKKYQSFTSFTDGVPLLVDKSALEQVDIIRQLLITHYGIRAQVITLDESEHYVLLTLKNK